MNIQELLQEACDENDVELRSYSGRGMYGDTCIGIVGDQRSCFRAISDAIRTAVGNVVDNALDMTDDASEEEFRQVRKEQEEVDNLIRSLLNYRMDNMGLDIVVYWEDLEYTSQGEEEEEYED